MNATGKPILFLLTLFLLFGGIGLQTAFSNPPAPQLSEPEAQVTLPIPTLPIATQPPESTPPPGGGGGGLNTIMIGMLVVIALVAFVGLLLWVASRGRRSGL
jgi:hypothetical protein